MTAKAVRLIRMLRWRRLINSAQERTALDAVGAHDVQVQPFRDPSDEVDADPLPPELPASTTPPAPPASPTQPASPASLEPPEPPEPPDAASEPAPVTHPDQTPESTTNRVTLPSP